MFAWLSANLINIALVAVIVLIVALLIRGMIRDRKAGKNSCGGSCASRSQVRDIPFQQKQNGHPFRDDRLFLVDDTRLEFKI